MPSPNEEDNILGSLRRPPVLVAVDRTGFSYTGINCLNRNLLSSASFKATSLIHWYRLAIGNRYFLAEIPPAGTPPSMVTVTLPT